MTSSFSWLTLTGFLQNVIFNVFFRCFIMDKNVKDTVAFVIYENKNMKRFLIVQRPEDDDGLPNAWGLPAGSLKQNESYVDCVLRAGREKLGVELRIVRLINEGYLKRGDANLYMKEYEAEIVDGG